MNSEIKNVIRLTDKISIVSYGSRITIETPTESVNISEVQGEQLTHLLNECTWNPINFDEIKEILQSNLHKKVEEFKNRIDESYFRYTDEYLVKFIKLQSKCEDVDPYELAGSDEYVKLTSSDLFFKSVDKYGIKYYIGSTLMLDLVNELSPVKFNYDYKLALNILTGLYNGVRRPSNAGSKILRGIISLTSSLIENEASYIQINTKHLIPSLNMMILINQACPLDKSKILYGIRQLNKLDEVRPLLSNELVKASLDLNIGDKLTSLNACDYEFMTEYNLIQVIMTCGLSLAYVSLFDPTIMNYQDSVALYSNLLNY